MPDKLRSVSTYGIIDLMPDFWLFYAASTDLDVQEQARLFKTMVAEKHAEVYAAKIIWLDETKPYDEAIMARYIAWSERSTTEQINIIKRMSDSIAKNMAEYEEKFRATFLILVIQDRSISCTRLWLSTEPYALLMGNLISYSAWI